MKYHLSGSKGDLLVLAARKLKGYMTMDSGVPIFDEIISTMLKIPGIEDMMAKQELEDCLNYVNRTIVKEGPVTSLCSTRHQGDIYAHVMNGLDISPEQLVILLRAIEEPYFEGQPVIEQNLVEPKVPTVLNGALVEPTERNDYRQIVENANNPDNAKIEEEQQAEQEPEGTRTKRRKNRCGKRRRDAIRAGREKVLPGVVENSGETV